MSRIIALAALVTFAVAGAPVFAQTTTVIGFEGSDEIARSTVEEASLGALRGASAAAAAVVTDYTNVSLTDTMQLIGCSGVDPGCLQELASTLGTRIVIFGTLRQAQGAVLDLTVYDASEGRATLSTPLALPADGVADHVATRVAAFLGGNVVLNVRAAAPGGEVFVDGRSIGRAPATSTAFEPGPHQIRVAFDDGRSAELGVQFDNLGEFELTLAPSGRVPRAAAGPTVDRSESGPRPLRIAGWSAVGASVAAFALAGSYGSKVQDTQDAFDATPFQREAQDLADQGRSQARTANLMVGIGAALAVGGATALILDRGDARRDSASLPTFALSPQRGGAFAAMRIDL